MIDRLMEGVEKDPNTGCWLFWGATGNGYGRIGMDGRTVSAHRVAYELLVGPIPDGLILDHVCHNTDRDCPGGSSCRHRRCVNPSHLEPVTPAENHRRAAHNMKRPAGDPGFAVWQRAKTHCPYGHPLEGDNLYVRPSMPTVRVCKACRTRRGN